MLKVTLPGSRGGRGGGEGGGAAAGVTLRDDIKLFWLSLSEMSSKKGCRLGGAVTGWLGCGSPLASKCSPAFCPYRQRVARLERKAHLHMLIMQVLFWDKMLFFNLC